MARWRSATAVTVGVLGALTIAAATEIPALREIPSEVASVHPELVSKRAALVQERNGLRERTRRHNAKCSAVTEGTPEEASCRSELAALTSDVNDHIQRSNDFNKAVSAIVAEKGASAGSPPAHSPAKLTAWAIQRIEYTGDFYILTSDGRKLTGQNAALVPIDNGAQLFTGKNSHVHLTLPDGTVFTVGPLGQIQLDEFVWDPNISTRKVVVSVIIGVFRWVTGKVAPNEPQNARVKWKGVSGGIRGTDFEIRVAADDSGYVTLRSGQLEITEKKSGLVFLLNAGQKVEFSSDGTFSRPMPMR